MQTGGGFDDRSNASISGREQRLLMRDARRHGAHFHVGDARQLLTDELQTSLQFFFRANCFPLKWCVGLWYEAVQRRNDLSDVPELAAGFEHAILDALDQHDHLVQIFISLSRQAHHQIEFYRQHAPIEDRAADIDYFVISQVLIDDATQSV